MPLDFFGREESPPDTVKLSRVEQKLKAQLEPVVAGELPALSKLPWGEIVLIRHETLIGQLTTRKSVFDSRGRIGIEKKEDLRKRGLHSPDRALRKAASA